jgi:hypothetical protein
MDRFDGVLHDDRDCKFTCVFCCKLNGARDSKMIVTNALFSLVVGAVLATRRKMLVSIKIKKG